MRALIWLIGIFALAAGVAMLAGLNEGYVLVVFPPWRAQLSLNLLLVLLVLGFVLGYLLIRLVRRTLALPAAVGQWRERRRRQRGGQALRDALRTLFEGRFTQSLKFASSAYASGESPAVAALLAARAAHAMHDDARYRVWLGHAAEQGTEARVARLMTEAELAIDHRRFDEAAERLETLKQEGHRHIAALRLSLRVAIALRRWDEALRLTRQLRKHKALSDEQALPLLRRVHLERFKERAGEGEALASLWNELPADELTDRRLVERVVPLLAEAGQGALARRTLERLLDAEWDEGLARLYGHCGEGPGDAVACLVKGEDWLKAHSRDAGLLFALGRLCIDSQLWGKAQSYLEASLNLAPTVETHLALAKLLERLEHPAEAQRHYRAAAERVTA